MFINYKFIDLSIKNIESLYFIFTYNLTLFYRFLGKI